MCSAQVSTSDRSAGLSATPPWRVVAVAAMPALVNRDAAGVFASLREPSMFEAVHVEPGAVTWPGEIDLAPDALYAAIKEKGGCVLAKEGIVQ